jgi:hypothetical protein
MKNKLMVGLMVLLVGAVAAAAREKNSERDRREEKRKEAAAARAHQNKRRCGNDDEAERERIRAARHESRECREPIIDYGPPIPAYGCLGTPLPYYLPVAPGCGNPIPGRFYPIPIPRRPVYVLPGMP